MKISGLCKFVAMASLALAPVSFVFTPTTAVAQIKGAQRLIPLRTAEDLSSLQPGDTIIMSCPKCKDTYASVVDTSIKGGDKTKDVTMHLCPTCDMRMITKGTGRTATSKLVHTCKTCGSKKVTCCVMKKDGAFTPGMGEKK